MKLTVKNKFVLLVVFAIACTVGATIVAYRAGAYNATNELTDKLHDAYGFIDSKTSRRVSSSEEVVGLINKYRMADSLKAVIQCKAFTREVLSEMAASDSTGTVTSLITR